MTLAEDHRRRLRDIVLSPANIVGKCDKLDELLALVRAEERERCAAVCDSVGADMSLADQYRASLAAGICAGRIRQLD